MIKLQLATKQDLKEAAKIEHRRRLEEERKSRIFNPRWRVIGVDVAGIQQQLTEKEAKKQHDSNLESNFHRIQESQLNLLNAKLGALANERRELQREINEYRNQKQKPQDAREFDLNDPHYLRNSLPTRTGDHDPRLTISSAQVFMGEDLGFAERVQQQKRQQRAWLQQQINERQKAKADYAKADRALQNAYNTRDERIKEIDEAERQIRREIHMANAQFNLQLAQKQQKQAARLKEETEKDNLAEMYNNLTSDMLTENKECAIGNQFGPGRRLVSLYRGMTDAEIAQIHKDQETQRKNDKQNAIDRMKRDAQFDKMLESLAENVQLKEENLAQLKGEQLKELRHENLCLADKQRRQNEHINKVVYTNKPTEEYFNQFNTTSR